MVNALRVVGQVDDGVLGRVERAVMAVAAGVDLGVGAAGEPDRDEQSGAQQARQEPRPTDATCSAQPELRPTVLGPILSP